MSQFERTIELSKLREQKPPGHTDLLVGILVHCSLGEALTQEQMPTAGSEDALAKHENRVGHLTQSILFRAVLAGKAVCNNVAKQHCEVLANNGLVSIL